MTEKSKKDTEAKVEALEQAFATYQAETSSPSFRASAAPGTGGALASLLSIAIPLLIEYLRNRNQ